MARRSPSMTTSSGPPTGCAPGPARTPRATPAFDRLVRSLGRFLAELGGAAPPDINAPGLGDALTGLKLTRSFRGLGKHDGRSILRVLPMAIADFVAESFETDALRGILAARGIQNTAMGPWSAGTTAVFLADSAGNDGGAAGQTVYARGGPGALSAALAAAVRAAGGEIRTDADVVRVTSRDGRATGVVLGSGEEIAARFVVAGIDPKKVLTALVDPVELGPGLRWRAGNIRTPGTVAKVNLALAGLPVFPAAGGRPGRRAPPARQDRDRARHRLRRTGLRRVEVRRDQRGTLSRGDDPVARRPDPRRRPEGRRPAAGPPRHEHPSPVRAVPPRRGHLAGPPRRAGRSRDRDARGSTPRGSASSSSPGRC